MHLCSTRKRTQVRSYFSAKSVLACRTGETRKMSAPMMCLYYLLIISQFGLLLAESGEKSHASLTPRHVSEMKDDMIRTIKSYLEEEDQKLSQLSRLLESVESKPKANGKAALESFEALMKQWLEAEDLMNQKQNVELTFRVLPLTDGATLKLDGYHDDRLSREVIEFIEYKLHWNLTEKPDEIPRLPIYTAECEDERRMYYGKVAKLPSSLYFVADPPLEGKLNGPNTPTKGVASAPCIFYIAKASIPGAGRGVFAKVDLTPGMIIGPYDGLYLTVSKDDWTSPRKGHSWSYAWKLANWNVRNNMCTVVDAISEHSSNWLRFINMPRFEEEQNMYAVTISDDVYYLVYKHIPAHTELLVWYGGMGYANWLGIYSIPPDLEVGLIAPPRAKMRCPNCKNLPTVKEAEQMALGRYVIKKDE